MNRNNALGLTFAWDGEPSDVASATDSDSATAMSNQSIPDDAYKHASPFNLSIRRWGFRGEGRSCATSAWRWAGSSWKRRLCSTMRGLRRRLPVVLQAMTSSISNNLPGIAPRRPSVFSLTPSAFQCAACQSSLEAEDEDGLAVPCGHQYHIECLLMLVETSVQTLASFPPRCCRQTIPYEQFKEHLPRSLRTAYAERQAESDTPKRVYCADPRCSHFLGARDKRLPIRVLTCPSASCGTRTCARCKARVNTPASKHECSHDPGHRSTLQLGSRLGWVRCPTCEELIERDGGCAHMTCVCGAQFCYRCRALWRTCTCVDWGDGIAADDREVRLFAPLEEGGDLRPRLALGILPVPERSANGSTEGTQWLTGSPVELGRGRRPRSQSFTVTLARRDDSDEDLLAASASEVVDSPPSSPLFPITPPPVPPKDLAPKTPIRIIHVDDATTTTFTATTTTTTPILPFFIDPTLIARGIHAQESRRRRRATSL